MTARDFIEDVRRLWLGTCPTRLAVYHAACGFFALLVASSVLFETVSLAVAIPARAGAVALILPCCWLIPAIIGIHGSKAWTKEWESRRGWWRKGKHDDQSQPPDDPSPPSEPPRRPSAPAQQKELAAEFFRRCAGQAKPEDLQAILTLVPDRAPDPGDELQ